jgi:hypothetical protein
VQVLDMDASPGRLPGGVAFWQEAWNEIRRSRGEAIQAGFQEHVIVEEELITVLTKLVPAIRDHASRDMGFSIPLPAASGISGQVLFLRVLAIDDGFTVPDTELKVIRELDHIEQWRN